MDFLAQIGYFGEPNLQACSLYGLVLMVVSVWLAIIRKSLKKMINRATNELQKNRGQTFGSGL